MFSEKTTTLLSYARKYKLARKKVVLVKYQGDKRYNENKIMTHNQDNHDVNYSLSRLGEIRDQVPDAEVILIDEGQFFPDLAVISEYWAKAGKQVVISAVNGTFEQKPFVSISEIIPHVNRIIHLSAVCTVCGNDAHFSILKPHGKSGADMERVEGAEFIIGGADQYEARCRPCLP